MVRPTMRPLSSIPTDTTSKLSVISRNRETGCAWLRRLILMKQDGQQTVIRGLLDMPLHDSKTFGDLKSDACGHGGDDERALGCIRSRMAGNEGCTGRMSTLPGRLVLISEAILETFERLLTVLDIAPTLLEPQTDDVVKPMVGGNWRCGRVQPAAIIVALRPGTVVTELSQPKGSWQ